MSFESFIAGKFTVPFSRCRLSTVPVAGLFSCCSMGILHSEMSLTEVALKELACYKDDARYLAKIALLEAFAALIKVRSCLCNRRIIFFFRARLLKPNANFVKLHTGIRKMQCCG